MKTLRFLALTLCSGLLLSGTAFAAGQAASNTGCGLGTILWGNNADGSIMSQSLQATTNGTFGNQTFGITSGTLGCTQPANIAATERMIEFTAANLDNLAKDIAQGQGESLETLAELMAVPADQRVALYSHLQANFDGIFTTGNERSGDVLDRILLAVN